MTVKELADKLGLVVCSGKQGLNRKIKGAYVSDLLSDVMGNAHKGQVWTTLQTHKNIMAIALLKELAAIILVKGKQPDKDTAEVSNDEQIPILCTPLETFEFIGQLYELIKDFKFKEK